MERWRLPKTSEYVLIVIIVASFVFRRYVSGTTRTLTTVAIWRSPRRSYNIETPILGATSCNKPYGARMKLIIIRRMTSRKIKKVIIFRYGRNVNAIA